MSLPDLAGLAGEVPVTIPFTPPTEPRSAGDPESASVTFYIAACAGAVFRQIEDDATDDEGVIRWAGQAEQLFRECVKAVEATGTKREQVTVDDCAELASVWPDHVFRTLVNAVVGLNRVGAVLPKGR